MSEYQYYEFLAIDKPLTATEKSAIGQLSSRVKPTASSASFTYSYGDFPGNEIEVLAKYFDMMYYIANWGTQQLAFRFSKALIDRKAIEPYCVEDAISLEFSGAWAILNWKFYTEDGFGWIEEEQNILADLAGLRQEILQQDYRGLYLAWLKTLTSSGDNVGEINTSELEPPVPPGLSQLSSAQIAFVDAFELSENLLLAAAETSGEPNIIADRDFQQSIAQLPRKECDTYLWRLLQGESNLSAKLKQQLSKSIATIPVTIQPQRSIEQIFQAESEIAYLGKRRQKEVEDLAKIRQQEAARVKRQQDLKALAPRESQAWEEVDLLINKATAKTYDLAVELLDRLRDLAAERDNLIPFQRRLDRVYENYGRRAILIKRLQRLGLDRSN
jgi:hypothetical protein